MVGNSFEQEVLNTKKDVFIHFYAPWSEQCKQIHPIWDQLAESLTSETLRIARMDSTSNETDQVTITSFPTLMLFPAGKKDSPLTYSGEPTLDNFKTFLRENAMYPIGD